MLPPRYGCPARFSKGVAERVELLLSLCRALFSCGPGSGCGDAPGAVLDPAIHPSTAPVDAAPCRAPRQMPVSPLSLTLAVWWLRDGLLLLLSLVGPPLAAGKAACTLFHCSLSWPTVWTRWAPLLLALAAGGVRCSRWSG
ncbi:hypothetical protein NDU88_000506 [Pleurodeles waltl]|uniref:Uncharacterized protein n=1 Tax=Pleurodeles waltl TaxID=8319 RepID=A0AAV7S4S7_PLEWA|nr:hypothetical protein NDU88_000506 [Pleurodeles waltl]